MHTFRLYAKTALLIGLFPLWLSAQISVEIAGETTVSATEADISVSGNWNNRGTLAMTDSRLIFEGSEDQLLADSAGNILTTLVVDKPAGLLYLADTIRISDSLNLIKGKMVTADTSLLMLLSNAAAGKGDSASFVDGPVIKVFPVSAVEDTFWFPTGDDRDFRPLTVSLSEVAADTILVRVKQINQSAVPLSNLYDDLDRVSTVRYWQVNEEGPGTFTGARITLSYDTIATGDGVEIGDELRVAQLNTAGEWFWQNLGGSGSHDYAGRIRSDAFNDFGSGYFTFGDAAGGGDISLPVVLSLFELTEHRGEVTLNWKSDSEINNLYWLVQRKVGADSTAVYATIAQLDGQLTTSDATDYVYVDNEVEPGQTYAYRLADVSTAGRYHFHDPLLVTIGVPKYYQLYQNYPNPFNAATKIRYDIPWFSDVTVEVYDITGRKVATLVQEKQKAGYYQLVWQGTNRHGVSVASGMYILAFQAQGKHNGRPESYRKASKLVLVK
jgi:hypothetical protein